MEEVRKSILKFTQDRNWDQFHSPVNLAKSIVIESGELLECFQWDDIGYDYNAVCDELADVAIYVVQLADKLGVDLEEIIRAKLKKNEVKYPISKSRDNHKKYTRI